MMRKREREEKAKGDFVPGMGEEEEEHTH